jgi:hypothetical protein
MKVKSGIRHNRWLGILICVGFLAIATFPLPVAADGGPMVDTSLFTKLKEGQQVAVIRIMDTHTARVDLFVSILDQSGESHEITYFVPLGVEAKGFGVTEENSLDFNELLTKNLDFALFQGSRHSESIVQGLFAGTLLSNGIWLSPLWMPFLLSGCEAGMISPNATFTTESSTVSVFDIDETTDIQALVSVTGLDPAVTETLSRLQGQQIAVIKMKTAAPGVGGDLGIIQRGEMGLHLSWDTALVQSDSGATYAYPLGTGAAWSQPIDLTRVYIVAPADISLNVDFPRLGTNRSGYVRKASSYEPRIFEYLGQPAYAVEKTSASLIMPEQGWRDVNLWRVTYADSNSHEDIQITVKKGGSNSLATSLRQGGIMYAFFIGLCAAALFWVLSWYLLMPRLLGSGYNFRKMWAQPLIYLGINLLLLIIPGAILFLAFSFGQQAIALGLAMLVFGSASAGVFILRHLNRLGRQSIKAFIIVTIVSNAAYLLFALGYARLAGTI